MMRVRKFMLDLALGKRRATGRRCRVLPVFLLCVVALLFGVQSWLSAPSYFQFRYGASNEITSGFSIQLKTDTPRLTDGRSNLLEELMASGAIVERKERRTVQVLQGAVIAEMMGEEGKRMRKQGGKAYTEGVGGAGGKRGGEKGGTEGERQGFEADLVMQQWEASLNASAELPVPQTEPLEAENEEDYNVGAAVIEPITLPLPSAECAGKYVYMYDVPSRFNQDFVDNCSNIHRSVDMCEAFSHSGAGWPANRSLANGTMPPLLVPATAWYETDQFSLEITFHSRMKEYPCLTNDPLEAVVFYVPFYPGLAIFRSLYEKDDEKDRHAKEIIVWLQKFPWWDRHQGQDHLFVITRVLIDFTRGVVRNDWGNGLLGMSHMLNATFLGIESHPPRPKIVNVHSIPYPTSFHPSTDEDIKAWQHFVRNYPRQYLTAFAGKGRGMGATIRNRLWRLCVQAPEVCSFYDCRNRTCIMKPQSVMWFYLGGSFCFQPPGDTPTRKGFFDSILAGCIPVVFHEHTTITYKWHLPPMQEDLIVYMPMSAVIKDDGVAVLPVLKTFSKQQILRMRERLIKVIPSIVYAMPGNTLREYKDAFQIAMDAVLNKVSALKLQHIVPQGWQEP